MKTKYIVAIVMAGVILLSVFSITVIVVKAYRSPLGPGLEAAAPIKSQPDTTAPNLQPAVVCGESTAWNVLVLGTDSGEVRGEKGSDLTRILRVDFPNRKVTMYTFPRRLWVDTAGLGLTNPTVDAAQLGTIFYEARSRSTSLNVKDAAIYGTTVTARTLAKNFLVSTDHYITVDLVQIPAMVDAVGGVPINIPQQTTDPWIGMVIPAGPQTLNGLQFVAYARAIPDSDFGRIQRNNLLLAALRERLLDPAVWANIPQLYAQFDETIATDLSPEQISHLSCLLKEVPANAIIQDQVRQEWTWSGPQQGSLLWDQASVINRLKELGLTP